MTITKTGKRTGFSHESARNESVEWYTPPEIFNALGIEFDLDPCAAPGGAFVPAKKFYTAEDDGLSRDWHGTVFCNPPYGKETPVWLRKLQDHGDGIALVFARTDPQWFQQAASTASAICFISGRVRFYQGSVNKRGGSPGAGSCLIAYGEKCAEALMQSGLGIVMRRANQ